MGKSPGKWIKTILFGKKNSKYTLSKNVASDKRFSAKAPVEDVSVNSSMMSDSNQLTERGVGSFMLEKGTPDSPCDSVAVSHANQTVDSRSSGASLPLNYADMRRQEQAATKAQASFRGYLARRAFRALKGIIRLQAVIRGHLVRRQAVATLRSMQAIIRIQALARGHKVKVPIIFFSSQKLTTNIFVRKLLITSPTAKPLSFQYDVAEPNSAWSWLERWSGSHFWEPMVQTEKITKVKPQKKQGRFQVTESENGKSKRIQKPSTVSNIENSASASFEVDKSKRHQRKATSAQTELVQEQPCSELERVKRNLRKISVSANEAPETEKSLPVQSAERAANSAPPDVSKQEVVVSKEDIVDSGVVIDEGDLFEAPSKTSVDEPSGVTILESRPIVDDARPVGSGVKMETPPTLNDELICKEEKSGKDNKIRKRRSLPIKHDSLENMSQNTQNMPSYMASTASAKAKLRPQGSPRISEDGADYGFTRRHSLPASTNGKLSSMSPRIQKHVQANGKGGSKINQSPTSSRDGEHDKVQPVWRR